MATPRNYQDPIFTGTKSVIVKYADDKQAKISWGKGDTDTKRAFILAAPGGGAIFPGLDWYAKRFTEVGYVFAEFEPGNGSEFEQIAHGGCANRFFHKNHNEYGITGSKFFGFGVSLGGSNLWAQNISITKILTDPKFSSPVNALYPKAKMVLRGSASMSGSVTDNIYKLIDESCVPHLDSHGDKDEVLPIEKSQDAIDQMNLMDVMDGKTVIEVKSRLDTYPGATHGLDGLHEIIVGKILIFYAGLMGIKPVAVPAIT